VLVTGIDGTAVPHEERAQSPADRIRSQRQAGAKPVA
jgi:hypothetical protein